MQHEQSAKCARCICLACQPPVLLRQHHKLSITPLQAQCVLGHDAGARCCCTRYRDLAVGNQPSGLTDAYQHSCRAGPLYHRFERRLPLPGGPNCCLEAPVQLLLSCLSHSSTAPASSESSAAVTPSTLIQCAAGVLNISFLICSSTLRGSTHLA